jgi:hypothetical protein
MQIVTTPADAESSRLAARLNDLLATLSSSHELLKQLLELAGRKLAAMRSADTETLQQCAADESEVLRLMFENEQERDAVLARLAQSLHWRDSRAPSLTDITARAPEPFSSRLRAKTTGLRQIAAALKEKNRLAAAVARNLHKHIRAVFDDVARVNQESVVYGPNGRHEQRSKQSWVDAVG